MILQSKRELDITRTKLRKLERLYDTTLAESDGTYARELTLRSLKRTIKQLKEELARFEAKTGSASAKQ